MIINRGILEHERTRVAELFYEAFAEQIGSVLGPAETARRFIAKSLCPEHALCARDQNGYIVGVAGFHCPEGALLSFDYVALRNEFGPIQALVRIIRLALMDHRTHPTNFAVEGICVDSALRNRGIGRHIVEALAKEAKAQGCNALSLKVRRDNSAAKRLYESCGFETFERKGFSLLPNLERSTLMVRQLA